MTRSAPQWNAYVAAGRSRNQRRARLEEVPEEMRAGVEDHVQTVFALRAKVDRLKRQMPPAIKP